MEEKNITPVNFAMQAGLYVGLVGIIRFALLTYSFDFAIIGLLYLLVALFYHVLIFVFVKRYKYEQLDGRISFFQAWNVSILIYFFGSILSGAIEFAFYKFINPTFLAHYVPKSIAAVQQFALQVQDASLKSSLNEIATNIAKGGVPTAIEMVMAHIQNTIFSGLFVSLIIGAILLRNKKNELSSTSSASNNDTL